MTDFHKIWIEQCEAAENIEAEFGCQQALAYLVGEEFRGEVPAFAAEIKTIFEPWQLASYLKTGLQSKPIDPELFVPRDMPFTGEEEIEFDADEIEDMRKDDIRRCTRELLLVERARGIGGFA